jgi:CheY-like chemotaxis protein
MSNSKSPPPRDGAEKCTPQPDTAPVAPLAASRWSANPAPATPDPGPEAQRVLLATADAVCVGWVVAQATVAGRSVEAVDTSEEAVQRALNGRYVAIVLDVAAPGPDVSQVVRVIRAWEGSRRRTPILALVAAAPGANPEAALGADVDQCLVMTQDGVALLAGLRGAPLGEAAAAEASAPGGSGADLDPNVPRSPRLGRLFLEQIPGTLTELASAVVGGDLVAARRGAHKLKGACLAVGAWSLAEAAAAIQSAAERGDLGPTSPPVLALGPYFDRVAGLLRAELGEAAPPTGSGGASR